MSDARKIMLVVVASLIVIAFGAALTGGGIGI